MTYIDYNVNINIAMSIPEIPGDIEFTPEGPSLGTVSVSADFSFTITAETTGDTCGEDVIEMTVVAGEENAGVVLTDGSNSCSISGNYVTPFTDTQWVIRTSGQIITIKSYLDLPETLGYLCSYTPDSTLHKDFSYTVTATSSGGCVKTETYTITVENDWSEGIVEMNNVLARQSKELQT